MDDPQKQLDSFLDEYKPEIASLARAAIKKLSARLPGALILVYDNYNALAIGFASSEKAVDALFSIALYPRWANFFFLQGAKLPNPNGTLKGSGSTVRHIRLDSAKDLDDPEIRDLMQLALDTAKVPMPPKRNGDRIIIKSISPNRRPRRPKEGDR